MKWISFKDRQPKNNEKILVYKISASNNEMEIGTHIGQYHKYWENDKWVILLGYGVPYTLDSFSHWQRLPSKPNF